MTKSPFQVKFPNPGQSRIPLLIFVLHHSYRNGRLLRHIKITSFTQFRVKSIGFRENIIGYWLLVLIINQLCFSLKPFSPICPHLSRGSGGKKCGCFKKVFLPRGTKPIPAGAFARDKPVVRLTHHRMVRSSHHEREFFPPSPPLPGFSTRFAHQRAQDIS
jgi:hypothetical protein